MPAHDKRVDAYIARAPVFAQAILQRLRAAVHEACPEVEETIKWNFPVFVYHGMLCNMAAFKQHAAFGFWKGALLDGVGSAGSNGAMGQLGRLTSVKDLPPKRDLIRQIRAAMQLNESGVARPRPKTRRARLAVPADLRTALATNVAAGKIFTSFPPSHQREYIEWLTEARTEATRTRRLVSIIEWVAAGKPRNWKYMARHKDLSRR